MFFIETAATKEMLHRYILFKELFLQLNYSDIGRRQEALQLMINVRKRIVGDERSSLLERHIYRIS